MKKMTVIVAALALALGVSVCSAQNNGPAAETSGINCKDGVCEFAPGTAGGERTAFAAINPYNNAVPDIVGEWARDVKQLGSVSPRATALPSKRRTASPRRRALFLPTPTRNTAGLGASAIS